MKRFIRLSEADLKRLIRRVINESEPTRTQYPDVMQVLGFLIDKTVKLKSVVGDRVIQVKIEDVKIATVGRNIVGQRTWAPIDDVRFSVQGKTEMGVFTSPVGVYLDVDLINEYGESEGGLLGTGKFNNLDILYKCGGNSFSISREFIGIQNIRAGNETYTNPKLQSEIENKFCRQGKTINAQTTNY